MSRGRVGGVLLGAAHEVERRVDRWWLERRKRRGRMDPLAVQAYRSFGTERELVVEGRVVEQQKLRKARPEDAAWRNLRSAVQRFTSLEMPDARLVARFMGREQAGVTDEEGYFRLRIEPGGPLPQDRVWQEVEVEMTGAPGIRQRPVRTTAYVLVPPVESLFGVISDIDDTVLRTGVTNKLGLLRSTFLMNAHTRLPFKGVAGFYRALEHGPTGTGHNPIFYVSSSPWNLYDLLTEFLDLQQIPVGPLMLRDLGLDANKLLATGTAVHKAEQIDRVLNTYPKLPFILIGDSGQEDPEIYRETVRRHPGRIRAVYIRDVTLNPLREHQVQTLAGEIRDEGVEMLLVRDTEVAAEHAVRNGFIAESELPQVRAEKEKDKRAKRTVAGVRRVPRR